MTILIDDLDDGTWSRALLIKTICDVTGWMPEWACTIELADRIEALKNGSLPDNMFSGISFDLGEN